MSEEQNSSQFGGIAADALRQAIERIERLEEKKKALQGDVKDVYVRVRSQAFPSPMDHVMCM